MIENPRKIIKLQGAGIWERKEEDDTKRVVGANGGANLGWAKMAAQLQLLIGNTESNLQLLVQFGSYTFYRR